MEIKTYEDASEIPEEYLSGLVDAQIECWWQRPFDEHMICKNPKCWAMHSIEEVYWSLEGYRDRVNDVLTFECTECNSWVEQFYKKDEYLEVMREYFKWEVSVLLLFENDEVEGFWIISKTNITKLIETEFNTRPWSYDKEELKSKLSEIAFWQNNLNEKELVCLHHVFVSSLVRKWNMFFELLSELLNINKSYSSLPIIWETLYASRFYPITRTMWFQDYILDSYWYVIQTMWEYSELLDFFKDHTSFSDKNLLRTLLKYKRDSLKQIWLNSKCIDRKFYTLED